MHEQHHGRVAPVIESPCGDGMIAGRDQDVGGSQVLRTGHEPHRGPDERSPYEPRRESA